MSVTSPLSLQRLAGYLWRSARHRVCVCKPRRELKAPDRRRTVTAATFTGKPASISLVGCCLSAGRNGQLPGLDGLLEC